jgi:hypothetical protein
MSKFKYIPPNKLSQKHVGKPTKLVLKNGKKIYGTIKEIRKNGIIFIPATTSAQIFFPIFFPFGFFFPFIIF